MELSEALPQRASRKHLSLKIQLAANHRGLSPLSGHYKYVRFIRLVLALAECEFDKPVLLLHSQSSYVHQEEGIALAPASLCSSLPFIRRERSASRQSGAESFIYGRELPLHRRLCAKFGR